MWNSLKSWLASLTSAKPVVEPDPETPDDNEFIPTHNSMLSVKKLKLSEDKVQRVFLAHAFRYNLDDIYDIRDCRQKEVRNRDEFLPEELEVYKDELAIINLLIDHARKDFMSRCYINHLDLLRQIAKKLINVDIKVEAGNNPELNQFWLDYGTTLLKPIKIRLSAIQIDIITELVELGILSEVPTATNYTSDTTTDTSSSDDLVMDGSSEKAEEKKSTLNFN